MKTMSLTPAERLLQELGVTEPKEIDLDAIAFYVGARVRQRSLTGCEAHILGCKDHAVITVNTHSSARRKRFSIAHELGHWRHHRGKTLICRAEEYHPRDAMSPEKVADSYAADLMMPRYLFQPCARQHARLNFDTVGKLADRFNASLTATAIRLIDFDHSPAFVISHGPHGRSWFARAPSVPRRWFPRQELDSDSFAFGVQFGDRPDDPAPRKIGADAWFDRSEAGRYMVQEQTVRVGRSETLTLILVNDEDMLEER
jgi:hypothetical protein